jgi:hypothetical protein
LSSDGDRPRNEIFGGAEIGNDPIPKRNIMRDDFGWEVPVETVPVPSQGKVYSHDSPVHQQQTIDIRAMTAREEDILTSRALIKKGTVITELIESCLIDDRVRAKDLIAGDRNALMISIRITGYGPEYKSQVTCPSCRTTVSHEFNLAELGIKTLDIDPISPGENRFEFMLPVTKKKVEFKFLTGADEEEISAETEKMRQLLPDMKTENTVTKRLEKTVLSVDGIVDRNKIQSFVRNMPALDSRKLRKYMADNEPGVDMTTTLECNSCGEFSKIQLPLGTTFFWPRD